jgi:hypothetical protein
MIELPTAAVYRISPGSLRTAVFVERDNEHRALLLRLGVSESQKRDVVAVILQQDDLEMLLREAAQTVPSLAVVFAECAAVATKKYVGDAAPVQQGPNASGPQRWMYDAAVALIRE